MRKAKRISRSFTVDGSILDYLQRTRSGRSRSDRLNELLRKAILQEQYEALDKEAARFFAAVGGNERRERSAATAATQRLLSRDEE
jgi:hypothetical protein